MLESGKILKMDFRHRNNLLLVRQAVDIDAVSIVIEDKNSFDRARKPSSSGSNRFQVINSIKSLSS